MTDYKYTDGGRVDSSAFDSAYYDDETESLYLVFRSGDVASYTGISSSTWAAFMTSDSLGQFYHKYLTKCKGNSVDQNANFVHRESEWVTGVESQTVNTRKFIVYFQYTAQDAVEVDAANIEQAVAAAYEAAKKQGHLEITPVRVEANLV